MTFKIRKLAAALVAASTLGIGSAHAAIVVNNWTLDLSAVGAFGPGGPVINNIDQIQFTGVANSQAQFNDGVNAAGDLTRTQGLLTTTSFLNNGVVILANGGLNTLAGYEVTMTFDVGGKTLLPGPVSTFTHLAGTDPLSSVTLGASGELKIYIEKLTGGIQSDQGTGLGYDDGISILIATFMVDAGLGGSFSPATFNGADDAQFHWVSGLAGVILDAPGGNDLGNNALLAVTASQFDADQNNDGIPDVSCPGAGGVVSFSPTSFCAQEDGRASLQTVPEPASLALVGLALAGFGASRRKSRK